jgi:hypothetical protein
MKTTLAILLGLTFCMNVFSQVPTFHSGGGGNGGDYIRMKFLEVGEFVLLNYKDSLEKINTVVTPSELRSTLNINVISVTNNKIFDNRQNPVDAIGEPSSITLYKGDEINKTGWYGIFNRQDLVEKLVLHEMLRAAGVNDDNYVYSTKVLSKFDSEKFDSSFSVKWCSETASFVTSGLKQGLYSLTKKEEITIYTGVLNRVQSLISPKHYSFVKSLVEGSLKIEQLLHSESSKTNFLKTTLIQLASDIKYIDAQLKAKDFSTLNNLGDNSKYAATYISNANKFKLYAETIEIEKQIIDIVLTQVNAYMLDSDNSRTKYYGVFSEIDTAKYSTSISYKRNALNLIKCMLLK